METSSTAEDFCDNGFHSRIHMYPNHSLILGIVNCIMIPLALTVNAALVYSLIKTKQIRKVSTRFMLLMTTSDCCIGLLVQTSVAILFTKYRTIPACKVEAAATCLTMFFGHLTGFSILMIALDRFVHMRFLYSYNNIMSRSRSIMIMVGCVGSAFLVSLSYLIGIFYKQYRIVNAVILGIDFAAITAIYNTYFVTYYRVEKHAKEMDDLRPEATKESKCSYALKPKPNLSLKMAKTIFIILAMVFICYVPYVATSMVWVFMATKLDANTRAYLELALYATYLLVYLSSILNSVIFINGNKRCRLFLLQTFSPYVYDDVSETFDVSRKRWRSNSAISIQTSPSARNSVSLDICGKDQAGAL